ncbi:glycine betaine ABC transporter substrate-binding protein [Pseudonocardia phyllosphaerae]|uniref:glycine betaine ABC transporter substrate-binding protein n=1 Tax=Pseudonocardia phyllosphaerae TaxID=3390502 RepID=UPI00397DE647
MRIGRSTLAASAITAAAALLLSGCGGLSSSGPSAGAGSLAKAANLQGQNYTVGGKNNFDEQFVLCEATDAALESAGATVTNRCGTGGTDVTRQALLRGDIDTYWEYTGTAWASFYKNPTDSVKDDNQLYEKVKQTDGAPNKTNNNVPIVWMDKAGFNNTYGFAIPQAKSQELKINTLSDMAAYLKAGKPGKICVETEYQSRDDGLRGLQKTYGFTLKPEQVETLDAGVIYDSTAKGQCLFGEVYTTDGRINGLNLKVLEDDKKYHVTYNAAPTMRKDVYDRNPDVAKVLDPIAQALDYPTILELNKQVSVDGKNARDVARDWMKQKGFIG